MYRNLVLSVPSLFVNPHRIILAANGEVQSVREGDEDQGFLKGGFDTSH